MSLVWKFLTWTALVVGAAMLAAVYGALHDQLSYSLSPEYFTRFKFVQFAFAGVGEMPPRVGAAVVGALATWWVGAIAGVAVAGAGFTQPTATGMARSTLRAFALLAVIAAVAGLVGLVVGWVGFGSNEGAAYVDWWRPAGLVSPRRFFAVGMMHNASYFGGALGCMAAVVWQVRVGWRARTAAAAGKRRLEP
jgi:hypothetical protein